MAKKKKPAANPARGFATTSIASKPKPEIEVEKTRDVVPAEKGASTGDTSTAQNGAAGVEVPSAEKDLHELTPEELTEQLERNELQLLVDNYGPKVRREVSRLDSKLRSDGRVLRSQALDVSLRKWLPDELMNDILDTIKQEREEAKKIAVPPAAKTASEEDLVFRCWTLWEALIEFGIPLDSVKNAVRAMIENPPSDDAGAYVWGFRDSVDLLAIDLDEDDLPGFETRKSRNALQSAMSSMNNSELNTPFDSRSPSPEPKVKQKVNGHTKHNEVPDEGTDVSASDIDSDVEPDDLVAHYLSIKERMYKHKPELVEVPQVKGKKTKQNGGPLAPAAPLKANERRLQAMMKTIESDPLFDQHEAEQRWSLRRIQIMQEVAATKIPTKSAAVDSTTNGAKPDSQPNGSEAKVAQPSPNGSVAGDDDILGDMFAAPDDEIHATVVSASPDASSKIKIRDMGRLTGMNPSKILEDACRGRDSRASVRFRIVSASTYVSRHAATISWSSDQDRITADPVPYIRVDQRPSSRNPELVSSMIFTMTDVATADAKLSEAFIATVALFYVMSTSAKEEKQYLKLPPNFRDLYLELAAHQKQGIDAADREKLKIIKDMINTHNQQQEDDGVVLSAAFRSRGLNSPRPGSSRGTSPAQNSPKEPSRDLVDLWNTVQSSPRFQQMLPGRMGLPMFSFKEAALQAIDSSQVIILCGETGCGKSTQLPSYVLEHELSRGKSCKIYCTQPRRISAISLAQRVSEELGEQSGDVGTMRSLVGYAIRLESKISSRTRLVYATTGVVLRMLESSKSLDDITHLIIDEVHERSIDTDFLLIVLQALMARRPELKVILMSATVDANKFSRYLGNAPVITVPGRTFPVQTRYLEDAIEITGYTNSDMKPHQQSDDDDEGVIGGGTSGIPKQLQGYSAATRNTLSQYDEYRIDHELIVRLMEQIATDPAYADFSKATLVFMPGIAEIRDLNNMLSGSPIFQHNCWVIPLHSTIASEDQQLAFKIPPPGVRKVVIATNIAETGITIPDVTCVIDTGKHKEMRFDERRQTSRLIQSFISRANAKQRRGRAGRVQEGLCFHLFTKHRHDELMAEQQTPEMLRLSLQELVIRVKTCGLGQVEETLALALDPPLAKNVRRAIDALIEVGALTQGEDLTTLGTQIVKLPLDANLGKLCLMSAIFGCLDVGLTIAAILSSKSPFVTPFGDRQRADNARLAFAKGDSDLLTAYNAYTTWRRISQTPGQSVHAFCRKNYISHQSLSNIEDLKSSLLSSMTETGLVQIPKSQIARPSRGRQQVFAQVPAELDRNSANDIIVSSVIAWSFYPKVLIRDGNGFSNVANSQKVSLHPSSVNKYNRDARFLSFTSLMASASGANNYNAMSTTAVQDVPLLLMAGDGDWRIHAGILVIDGNRLRFRVGAWKDAAALKAMRSRLREIVDAKLKEPKKHLNSKLQIWTNYWEAICLSFIERSRKS